MAKEESPRNWDEEHKQVHENYVHDYAQDYLKAVNKYRDDDYFSGTPITTNNGAIARAIISLVCDRTGIYTHEVDSLTRKDLQEISEEIIAQGLAADATAEVYERMLAVDAPVTQEDIDDERVDRLNAELKYYHNLAEVWAIQPKLTTLEACHGVARSAYAARFDARIPRETPVGDFNPDRVYDALYDMSHVEEIKKRQILAAKDLFGNSFNQPAFGIPKK